MCNLYDIGPERHGALGQLEQLLSGLLATLPKLFGIRKTDPGAIVRIRYDEGDGALEALQARWGFHRPFNPAINNARADKLTSGMWNKAWRERRRCVIPASSFYEWTGPKGHKRTHAIEWPQGRMWMAGLWEEGPPDCGLCFTTLTTGANPAMKAIHDRMPVILPPEVIDAYLTEDDPLALIQPFAGELKTYPCANPLVKGAHVGPPIPLEDDWFA